MNNWSEKRLGEVCTLQRGFDLPTRHRETGNYPLISSSGFIDTLSEAKVSGPGVVTGRSGSIGSVFFIDRDFWPLNTTLYVKDFHGNDPRFIFHLLRKFDLKRFASGSGVPTLNRNSVHSELVYVPSNVSEQKRIVAILDEAFEGIDRAIANTEKNLANSRELFESYLNAIFTQKGNGWVEKKLQDTCIVERGSSPRPIQQFLTNSSDGVNWIKIGDTKGINKYIYSTNQKITKEGAKQSRRVEPGDFILTNSMSYGKPYIMATEGYIHDGWFILRLAENIDTDFFYYLLASNLVQQQFKLLAAGSVVKNISSELVKRAVLPIPPICQQKAMVKVIENLASETKRLETIYRQKIAALKDLKQSILQKAFTGELTADTPKTVKEELAA